MRRRKKIKVHYGNLCLLVLMVGVLSFGVYKLYTVLSSDETSEVKEEKKDAVIEKLVSLGYSYDESKIIKSKLSEEVINSISVKYEKLALLVSVDYFHFENVDRYEALISSSDYSVEEIVMRVNIGIDKEFYSDIKSAIDPDGLMVLVNKTYKLDDSYEPNDLISVGNGERMQREAGENFLAMYKDMKNAGFSPCIVSGYRSISTQSSIYSRQVNNKGQAKADLVSARPGHSEHHTGLAIDIDKDCHLEEYFENTDEFKWLDENAFKYGFILRYPKDKTYITGYSYEPWHYRYVGVEAATLIKNEGITFEEYYVKYKGLF